MKKSKITSQFKYFVVSLFIIAIFYTIYWHDKTPKSIYSEGIGEVKGTITSCTEKENGYQIVLKNKEKIVVNYYNDFKCTLGIKVHAKGEFKLPGNNTIFNLFNYKKYLLSQKINYTFLAHTIEIIDTDISINYQIKNSLTNRINQYKSKEYLKTFILGDSKTIDGDVMNSYRSNGVSHLLAISGMHITLLSAILLYILNLVSKNKRKNYVIVILILLFYVFLTNFTPSVVRATLLFTTLTVKNTFKLPIETKYLLILICTLYLFYNPFMIYHIGFMFSFIIAWFLIQFSYLIEETKNYIGKTFIISLIAFLASTPILINNFFNINLLSPLINVIFVPLVSIIIFPLSVLTIIMPFLDSFLHLLTILMENISLYLEKISYFNIPLKHMNLSVTVFYYLIIYYTIKNLKNIKCLLIVLIIFVHYNINYLDKYPAITMIDVGQGDSLLIKLPYNKGNILVDTGGEFRFDGKKPYDIMTNKTIPYLKSEGIHKIDYLILTHGDFDHVGMAGNLLNNFKVEKIFLNNQNDNILEQNIINLAETKNIEYERVGEKTFKIKEYKFEIFNRPLANDENDDSLIVYTKINGQNILLMGDASAKVEKHILDTYKLPKVDILKIGHHGSKTSTSPELLSKTLPRINLISAGRSNLYNHPHTQTIKRLENSIVLITKTEGSVKLTLKDKIFYTSCPLQR